MFRGSWKSLAAVAFIASPLTGCAVPVGDPPAETTSPRSSDPSALVVDATSRCSKDHACGEGFYCAPAAEGTCGEGTCTASPGDCPLISDPVCGCDGKTYLNACFATMGSAGAPGTTSSGELYVDPNSSKVDGTWSRVTKTSSGKTTETLVLKASGSYTLTESTGCGSSGGCVDSESEGTFTMSTVGVVFAPTSSTNAASLAIDMYLERTCPLGGPLQLVGAEPPGGTTMVYLTRE